MSYKIEKQKTEKEIIDFKAEYLQDCFGQGYNLGFAEDENYIYALEEYEKLQDGEVVDISQTPEYIAEQKKEQFQNAIQYQHDAFNEYSREIVFQIQYNTALSNTTLILNLEEQLKAEQQAVIERINNITTAYNGGTT